MRRALLAAIVLMLASHAGATCTRYGVRKDQGQPGNKHRFHWYCDTAAELPSGVYEGDSSYSADNNKLWSWTGAAWSEVGGGGGSVPSGLIMYIDTGTCPSGFTELTSWAGKVVLATTVAAGDVGTTGGADSIVPAGTNSAPTFTGSALGTHSHGAGTLAPSAHSGTAVDNHAAHTHAYTEIVNHTHPVTDPGHTHLTQRYPTATGSSSGFTIDTSMSGTLADNTLPTKSNTTGVTTTNPAGGVASGTTANPSATLTHAVTQPSAHTMSGSSSADSAGTPAGTNTAPTFTGTSFDNRSAWVKLIPCKKD